jgi:hypothetical protein
MFEPQSFSGQKTSPGASPKAPPRLGSQIEGVLQHGKIYLIIIYYHIITYIVNEILCLIRRGNMKSSTQPPAAIWKIAAGG